MTQKQITWAKSHDWYVATLASGDGVLVIDVWFDRGNVMHRDQITFTDFQALRDWAGY